MRQFGFWALLGYAVLACSSDEKDEPGIDAEGDPADSPEVPVASCSESFTEDESCGEPSGGTTYYVSSSAGDDSGDGLSEETPLATLDAVNELALGPGDQVLFACGDVWENQQLVITESGAECGHIVFGSYPRTCADQPEISGSTAVTGWTQHAGDVWVADLDAAENAGKFPVGINQLFRDDARLPMGKWPNADDPAFDHGYSFIERSPSDTVIQDDELPAGDWTGAVIRIKAIRWLLLSRYVVSSGDQELTLNDGVGCYDGGCGNPDPSDPEAHGWGYVITNHLDTLDQEGEWYFDAENNDVYLFSAAEPTGIEGSVLPEEFLVDDRTEDDLWNRGGIVLGENLERHITHVVVENLAVTNQPGSGIATPINLELDDNSNLVIRCNTVQNPNRIGISLATWVWNAGDESGWRGGHDQVISDNVIDGANRFGIHSIAYRTTFQNNRISNIGLAQNLTKSGLGCGFEGSNCTAHGAGIHVYMDNPELSSHSNTFRGNRVERVGACGILMFGHDMRLEENLFSESCSTKGDCGGICTFGGESLDDTGLYNVTLRRNIVIDTVGVTDGDNSNFKPLFGFGLYIDHSSRNVVSEGNTVARSSAAGILYQNSTGALRDNVVFGNSYDRSYGGQIVLTEGSTEIEEYSGNVLVTVDEEPATLFAREDGIIDTGDGNTYLHTYRDDHVRTTTGNMTLADWRAASGIDQSSVEVAAEPGQPELFENPASTALTVELTGNHVTLGGEPVTGSVEVPPWSSLVLIAQ